MSWVVIKRSLNARSQRLQYHDIRRGHGALRRPRNIGIYHEHGSSFLHRLIWSPKCTLCPSQHVHKLSQYVGVAIHFPLVCRGVGDMLRLLSGLNAAPRKNPRNALV